ncbi:MAG TPA: hypothetical protein VFN11_14620, partial [Ktedonobacterales bacterium]|nr:hypothetical protein [Ktedonobacterales bacterium]
MPTQGAQPAYPQYPQYLQYPQYPYPYPQPPRPGQPVYPQGQVAPIYPYPYPAYPYAQPYWGYPVPVVKRRAPGELYARVIAWIVFSLGIVSVVGGLLV